MPFAGKSHLIWDGRRLKEDMYSTRGHLNFLRPREVEDRVIASSKGMTRPTTGPA